MDPTPNPEPAAVSPPPSKKPVSQSWAGWTGLLVGLCGMTLAFFYLYRTELAPVPAPPPKPLERLTPEEQREFEKKGEEVTKILGEFASREKAPENKEEERHKLLETAGKVAKAFLKKESSTPAPASGTTVTLPPSKPAPAPVDMAAPVDVSDRWWIGQMLAGSLALMFGGCSWVRGENRRMTWLAVCAGVTALAFKYLFYALALMVLASIFSAFAPG